MQRGRRHWLLAGGALLGGCAASGRSVFDSTRFEPGQLAKTDIDRVVEAHLQDVLATLRRLTDKLYRRNPREWGKGGAASLAAAVIRVMADPAPPWPELSGRRQGEAIHLAFDGSYAGDRVLALMAGLRSMIDQAFENKRAFYLFDDLNEQKLYNCARNVEVAVWMLANRHDSSGAPWLLANETDGPIRNLSFEREFGRIIGNLDVLARIIATKNARTLNRIVQNLATAVFLPI